MSSYTPTRSPRGRLRSRLTAWAATVALALTGIAALAAPARASPGGGGGVIVINLVTDAVTATIALGTGDTLLYVANNRPNTMSVVDTATNTVTITAATGASPFGIALSFRPAPAVTGVSPRTGSITGGTSVTGTGFNGATAVYFGTVAATSFTVVSATRITATAPDTA